MTKDKILTMIVAYKTGHTDLQSVWNEFEAYSSSSNNGNTIVSRLLPSDEQIANAANNHQLGGYEWQSEKRKSFELGAKWARMVISAELSEGNNG